MMETPVRAHCCGLDLLKLIKISSKWKHYIKVQDKLDHNVMHSYKVATNVKDQREEKD